MPPKPGVVLVDDDRDLFRRLSMRLSAAGYDVAVVTVAAKVPAQSPAIQGHALLNGRPI